MKNFYIILILFFSFTIYSCAKKSDSSSSSSTTELEGTWQTPCHLSGSYYRIKKLTVSGTNWTDTAEYHSDSSCATDYVLWVNSWGSLSIGEERSGGSGHQFTLTLSDITFTSQTSDDVTWNNNNSWCGLTGWEINTPQSAAGKTCGASSFIWATGLAVYGTYLLDGSKLFWAVSSSAYPSSVDVGDNETFTKQ